MIDETLFILIIGSTVLGFGFMLFMYKEQSTGFGAMLIGLVILYIGLSTGGYIDEIIESSDFTQKESENIQVNDISFKMIEKYSNFDDRVIGTIRIFEEYDDPLLFMSKELISIPIIDGVGSVVSDNLIIGRNYSVYFDGGEFYYDEDLGIYNFNIINRYRLENFAKVGGLVDFINEDDSKYFYNRENQVTVFNRNHQLISDKDKNLITYNMSTLSGKFSIPLVIMTTGANSELRDFGLTVEFDSKNSPEGNEYDFVYFDCVIGCSLIDTDKDYTDWWKNQETLKFNNVRNGIYEVYRINFETVDILIGEETDVWYLKLDDLSYGNNNIFGNQKVVSEMETFDAIYR